MYLYLIVLMIIIINIGIFYVTNHGVPTVDNL